jgi:cytochrome c biogenesis protein CcdA
MILLLAFAVLAGATAAVTPCVLPVLPALLSASGTGGRRRALGIVAGLTLTHTITIVGIASVVDGVGFADGTLRTLSIALLALFGIALLVPRASEWIEQRLSFLSRLAPRSAGEGFWSGLPVGGALGFWPRSARCSPRRATATSAAPRARAASCSRRGARRPRRRTSARRARGASRR